MNISVIGVGYVGLVSAACFADLGHNVIVVDIDEDKIKRLQTGDSLIYEKDLPEIVQRNIGKKLTATTDLNYAINNSSLTFIAVGTPYDKHSIDLTYVKNASQSVGVALSNKAEYHTVVIKSTVTPGTTIDLVRPILEKFSGKKCGQNFGLGMNPEFLREGEAINDFMFPDRVVIGGYDAKSSEKINQVYDPFLNLIRINVDPTTAEMIKYASNALFATSISFANEIGSICSAIGIDSRDVFRGLHEDRRLSFTTNSGEKTKAGITEYLFSGCGFGGSCFPKDIKALISCGSNHNLKMPLLNSVLEINENQVYEMIRLLDKYFDSIENKTIGILGLAFKPGTDDIRESPSIKVIKKLLDSGVNILTYDPIVKIELMNVEQVFDLKEISERSDALMLMTSWQEFMELPEIIKNYTTPPLIIDGRGMLDKGKVRNYLGIGC